MMIMNFRAVVAILPVAVLGLAGPVGCSRNAHLADKDIRDVTVRSVTHFDIKLDEQATAKETAFVLLKAMRDDFFASNEAQRKAAIDVQYDVAAADVLTDRISTTLSRSELLYRVVSQWTPTVSHYVHDLETEWPQARERLVRVGPRPARNGKPGVQECQVVLEVADADADPNAQVLLVAYMIQDGGFWRVLQLGFVPGAREFPDGTSTTGRPTSGAEALGG
jgi:hypothetical protein